MSRVPKKADFLEISIYSVLGAAGLYISAGLGACFDIASDEDGNINFESLTDSFNRTLADTHLVISKFIDGGYAMKFTLFAAFAIGIYALMKITGRKRFHRKGEEHGSARWGKRKEILSLAEKGNTTEKNRGRKKKRRDEPSYKDFEADGNIILTNEVKMSLDTRKTRKNLNVLCVGSSGSGKSRFFVKPNLMQANTSYVCTDPKGELLRSTGRMLEHYGYKIKVLNLIDMAHSHSYNPFNYIYDQEGNYSRSAVIKMIRVLMKNTKKDGGGGGGDQFWEDSTKALLSALCFYLVECESAEKQNFSEVMKLLKKAEVSDDNGFRSELDIIFESIEKKEKDRKDEWKRNNEIHTQGEGIYATEKREFMCLKYYKDFKKAAGDTAKSILISTAVRLQAFNIPEVINLTSSDSIGLDLLGDEKSALFVIIPSSDDTFNFLAAMLYTQLFDVLYDRANFRHKGCLPIHVRCLLDEFANIGEIPRFEELLATMRSMGISANVIIQNLSQLKKMYKESWENILGNCDSFLFLGGQEPTTLDYITKALGKETIDTLSRNRSRGRNGSTSENDGIMGRELMTNDELKVMKDNECILFVRGMYPFFCNKFCLENHPNYDLIDDSPKGSAFEIQSIITESAQKDDTVFDDLYYENLDKDSLKGSDENALKQKASDSIGRIEGGKKQFTIEDIRNIGNKSSTRKETLKFTRKEYEGKIQKASLRDSDTVLTVAPEI